ncbi:MAG: N-acetylneuraminate synthase family protein [Acidobacteriota bacterium]|nr:N-acetylneuraminate synthase family protein [Acidobacteriota bacterium]
MRPILIAECCQNHNGRRDLLQRMIHQAAEAGADFVKLQAIRSRELTHRPRFDQGERRSDNGNEVVEVIQRPYQPELERLRTLDLTLDDEAWFVDECRRAGVASMTTLFTRTACREVEDLGYDAAKIASYDCRSYPLLRDVAERWSTVVCSTGATYDHEIEGAAYELAGTELTLLHCVTIYPTPMDQLHLRRMSFLRRFTPRVGWSDHTKPAETGLWASKIALALGATCIERHFTVLGPGETKDGPVSITPEHLKELRAFADLPRAERMALVRRDYPEWEQALGQARRSLSHGELLNRDYYAGRFASRVAGRWIYNWEDVDLDPLLDHEAPTMPPSV